MEDVEAAASLRELFTGHTHLYANLEADLPVRFSIGTDEEGVRRALWDGLDEGPADTALLCVDERVEEGDAASLMEAILDFEGIVPAGAVRGCEVQLPLRPPEVYAEDSDMAEFGAAMGWRLKDGLYLMRTAYEGGYFTGSLMRGTRDETVALSAAELWGLLSVLASVVKWEEHEGKVRDQAAAAECARLVRSLKETEQATALSVAADGV